MKNNKKEWKKPELTKIDVNFNTEFNLNTNSDGAYSS